MGHVCSSAFEQALGFVLLLFIGFFGNELLRRAKSLAFVAIIGIPILLTPVWISVSRSDDSFFWFKTYTIYLTSLAILLFRFTKLQKYVWISIAFLYLNIAEALLRGFFVGSLLSYLQCISGMLVILSIPSYRSVGVDHKGTFKDLTFDAPWGWILGYTFWNTAFIATTFPFALVRQFGGILSPLLIALIFGRKLWGQARAFTLAIFLGLAFAFPKWTERMDGPCGNIEPLALFFTVLALAWTSGYALRHYRLRKNI